MPSRPVRLTILLAVTVAIGIYALLPDAGPPDWDRPLKVVVYPENVDGSVAAARRIRALEPSRFDAVEDYFAEQAARHDLALRRPFEIELADPIENSPGEPDYSSPLTYVRWGLWTRWWYWWVFDDQGRDPDIGLIARFRAAADDRRLHSLGVPAMNLAMANIRAGREHRSLNDFLIAHELLHAVGARNLYDRQTGLPVYPEAYADPDHEPLYRQPAAELMAGRIPIGPGRAEQIHILAETMIGDRSAASIGWFEAAR